MWRHFREMSLKTEAGQKLTEPLKPEITRPNPLQNSLILSNLFTFLKLRDLKNCRLVCRTWLYSSELEFRNKSRVKLHIAGYHFPTPKGAATSPHAAAIQFVKNFGNFLDKSERNVPISALAFYSNNYPVVEEEIHALFQSHGSSITDLKLGDWDVHEQVNLPRLLGDNILGNLRRLQIHNKLNPVAKFLIPSLPLQNLEELDISGSVAIWLNGGKLHLKKLSLWDIAFHRGEFPNENNIVFIMLSEFVEIDALKELSIRDCGSLCVDMFTRNKNVKMDLVKLTNAIVSSWENSNWAIRKLCVDLVNIETKNTKMNIEELSFKNRKYLGNFATRYKYFPPCLKTLTIVFDHDEFLKMEDVLQLISFPNLKRLIITGARKLPPIKAARELTDLEFRDTHSDHLNLDRIPNSVKRLKIDYCAQNLISNKNCSLHLLVLKLCKQNINMISIQNVLSVIQPEILVIVNGYGYNEGTLDNNGVKFLTTTAQFPRLVKILLGAMKFEDEEEFQKSALSKLVDMQAEYYCFQNGKGKAICASEFENLANLILN